MEDDTKRKGEEMKKEQDWSDSRTKELKELRNLLFNLYSLDRGSSFIRNLKDCIRVATKLVSSSRNFTRPSFVDYLDSLCIRERVRRQCESIGGGKKEPKS